MREDAYGHGLVCHVCGDSAKTDRTLDHLAVGRKSRDLLNLMVVHSGELFRCNRGDGALVRHWEGTCFAVG